MPIEYPTKASPGLWIRAHLSEVGEDSVYDMWKGFVKFSKGFTSKNKTVSYDAFRIYINLAKAAGLLIPTRRAPSTMPVESAYKQFYRLDPRRTSSTRWQHLQYSVEEVPLHE